MLRALLRRPAAGAAALAAGALLLAAPAGAAPAWRAKVPDDALPARYKIEAELRTLEGEDFPRQIRGRETIVWSNLSPDSVGELRFLLGANAFRDGRSALARARRREGDPFPERMSTGGTEVQQILLVDSPGRQPTTRPLPAPDAPEDGTVLLVKLPQPVEPGGRAVLQVAFTTVLPAPVATTGAVRDFVLAAEWYPRLGRYVGRDAASVPHDGGWHCPPGGFRTAASSDFGDYDVTLTVPAGWTVGATGAPAGEETRDTSAGTSTRTWHARSVADFAWTASPRFVERRAVVDPDDASAGDAIPAVTNDVRWARSLLGLSGEEADLPPVEVVVLLQPEHADQAGRYLEAARAALALHGTWLGPYPWPRLTIVDPAHGARALRGLDLPGFVTAGTTIGAPVASRSVEHDVVRAVSRQWFPNVVAGASSDDAWLAEALPAWFTARAAHLAWGPRTPDSAVLGLHFLHVPAFRFPGIPAAIAAAGVPDWLVPARLESLRLWRDAPAILATEGLGVRTDADALAGLRRAAVRPGPPPGPGLPGDPGARGALLLESVARHVRARWDAPDDRDGERRVLRAFREFARQHRFGRAASADLVRVLRTVSEMPEIPGIVETFARATGVLDYSIEDVRTTDPEDGGVPVTEFEIRRRGEIVVPVTVVAEVHGADEPVVLAWDGAERSTRLSVPGRARSIRIDPARLFPQDADLSNGVWTDRPNLRPAAKWGAHTLLWLENALAGWGRFL